MTQSQFSTQQADTESQNVTQVPRGTIVRKVHVKPKAVIWSVAAVSMMAIMMIAILFTHAAYRNNW
jgi:hypothetical protein